MRAWCTLGWGKEKGEAGSSPGGDSAQTHTCRPAQPCVVVLRRERAQPKGAAVCLMERGRQYCQRAELTLMGKWEVGVIPGPERKVWGGAWKDMYQERQAKAQAPGKGSTEMYTSTSRDSARPPGQKVSASVCAPGRSVPV